jgi:hypothetical protein
VVFVPLAIMKGTKMRRSRAGFLLSIGLVASCAASALPSDSQGAPYHQIVERNAFHLSAFISPAYAPPTVRIPIPKISLTGITTILGRKFAFITIAGIQAGQLPVSQMLGEGEALNDVGVKSIDERAGLVQIINHGELQTLDFEHQTGNVPAP